MKKNHVLFLAIFGFLMLCSFSGKLPVSLETKHSDGIQSNCVAPSPVVVVELSDTSVLINWTPSSTTDYQWEYLFGVSGFDTTGATNYVTTGDTFALIASLMPNTAYDFYVRATCSDGEPGVWSAALQFTTPCTPISTFPFLETFEDTSATKNCWTIIDNGSATSWERSSDFTTHTGSYCMFLLTFRTFNSCDDYLISPPIQLTGNEKLIYQVSAYNANFSQQYRVVLSTTGTAAADFTEILFDETITNSADYHERVVDLRGYSGTVYIAFHVYPAATFGQAILIDDVAIESYPFCPPPSQIVLEEVLMNGAHVSWRVGTDEIDWDLAYGEQGFDLESEGQLIENIDTNYYEIENLIAITNYDVYVRSNCGSGQSGWTGPFTFRTLQTPATIPYFCDFQTTSENANWEMALSAINNWYISSIDIDGDTTTALVVSSAAGGHTYNVSSSSYAWAYRDVYFTPFSQYTISFDWVCKGLNLPMNKDHFSVYVGTPDDVVGGTSTYIDFPANLVPLTRPYDSIYFSGTSTWTSYSYTLDDRFAGTTQRLYFLWRNSGYVSGTQQPPATIDNLSITGTNCPLPSQPAIVSLSHEEATISWRYAIDALGSYDYKYDVTGTDPNGMTTVHVTDTFVHLQNLLPNTAYDFYVRATCSSTDSSNWTQGMTFQTNCEAVDTIPFYETFEPASPTYNCWRIIDGNDDLHTWQINNGNPLNGTLNAQINCEQTNDDYLISPPITLTGDEMLSFYHRVRHITQYYYPNTFRVLLSTTEPLPEHFTHVLYFDTCRTEVYEEVVVDLRDYTGVVYIAFHIPNQGNWISSFFYMDDISIIPYTDCAKVTNLTVSNITNGSAEISWNDPNEADSYEIEYGEPGFTLGEGTLLEDIQGTTHPITGLLSGTCYEFYVRAICPSGYDSFWSTPAHFSTSHTPVTSYPHTEEFEDFCYDEAIGWQQEYVVGNSGWKWKSGGHDNNPSGSISGSYNAYFWSTSRGDTTKLISSPYNLTTLTNPQLSFWHAQKVWGSDQDKLNIYYKSNLTDEWTLLVSYQTEIPDWRKDSVRLPNPSAEYYLAFEGISNYGHGVVLDDITISEAPIVIDYCDTVSNVVAATISAHTATIEWTPADATSQWILTCLKEGEEVPVEYDVTVISYSIANLEDSTSYTVCVRTNCGNDLISEEICIEFTTLAEIVQPVYYTITATADIGGIIDPEGTIDILEGAGITFTFSTEEFYEIQDVLLNGLSLGAIQTYALNDIREDWQIHLATIYTGIDEYMESNILIYPNPVKNMITVRSDITFKEMEIITPFGQIIFADHITSPIFTIDFSDYVSGVYFIRLKNDNESMVKKIIRE